MTDIKEVIEKCAKYKGGKALSSYKLVYDSQSNQLEPIYYWLLDFMQDGGISVEKITDNFMSSPGSGQFSEIGQKSTVMQQQATKILADTNTLIKTILNLVYDLKEFEIRLGHYQKANSKDEKEKEAGMLALKNIWLDQVDLKRGRGSIHQMAAEMGFTTLREAFLIVNSTADIEKMASKDGVINDSVKRVLIPRVSEFLMWKDMSEKELSKRFEIEKSYSKSEIESLKLYTQWARPYLNAVKELRMKGFGGKAELVGAFSTTMFELTLLGKKEVKLERVPELKKRFGDYSMKRKYYSCFVVTLKFRGHLGQKVGQGAQSGYAYAFGGRVDITFDCYALNSEELDLVNKKLKEADLADGLGLVEDNTQIALDQLKDDIVHFLGEDKKEEKKKEDAKKQDDTNPFSALFSGLGDLFSSKKKEEKKKIGDIKDIKKDNFVEESVRGEAAKNAMKTTYGIYDVYKKAHGMASSPEEFENKN